MLVKISRIISVSMLVFFSFLAQAKDAKLLLMFSEIEKKQSSPELHQQAVRLGKNRALLCNECHGADGNSKKQDVPNLAAQSPKYLLVQIEKFSNGSRKNYVMNALSKNFSSEDKVNLALFYASMKVKPVIANIQHSTKGKSLYMKKCSSCHGEKGIGQAEYARLAGQKTHYIETTLRQFRANAKITSTNDESKRHSIVMDSVSKSLSDVDINVLAAYISQL